MRILTATLAVNILFCLMAPITCEEEAQPLSPSPRTNTFEMEVPESDIHPDMMDDINITPGEITDEELMDGGFEGLEGYEDMEGEDMMDPDMGDYMGEEEGYKPEPGKKKKEYLVVRLVKAEHLIEDLKEERRVVMFIENRPELLKDKTQGDGKIRKELIKELRKRMDHEHMNDVMFYFTDCSFLQNLCEEMQIDLEANEVVYLTRFRSTPIRLEDPQLMDKLWASISPGLKEFEDLQALDMHIEENAARGIHTVIFNFEDEEKEAQTERAIKFLLKCQRDCFNWMEFVWVKKPSGYLAAEVNKGKTLMIRKGEILTTPFNLGPKGKMNMKKTIDYVNNEGLPDVLENRNENYFKIYQNDMKAMVALMVNEEDEVKVHEWRKIFENAAYHHRKSREDYENRYTFVFIDLKRGDESYNKMVQGVTGEISTPYEIFLFTRGYEGEGFANYSLSENVADISDLLDEIPKELEKLNALKQRKQLIDDEKKERELAGVDADSKEPLKNEPLSTEDEIFLETANYLEKEWKAMEGVLKTNPAMNSIEELSLPGITERTMLAFLQAHDTAKLNKEFFKSENEDREETNKNLIDGVVKITGTNFDRIILNRNEQSGEKDPKTFSTLLLVCRESGKKEARNCRKVEKLLKFLRENIQGNDVQLIIGSMNVAKNEHPLVDSYNFQDYPAMVFYGQKEEGDKGKLFRGQIVVKKVISWLNRKLAEHEEALIELSDDQYNEMMLLTARNKK